MRRLKPASRASNKAPRLTQAERTAISDGRMLEAAMALVLERGTHNTTLREVGAQSVPHTTLRLPDGVVGIDVDQYGSKTGLEAFDAANESIIDFMNDNSDYIRAMFILYYETVGSSTVMRERLAEQHGAYRRAIARYISQGIAEQTIKRTVDPTRVALQYTSFFFGLVYQWLANPDAIEFESALHDFRDAMIQVIGETDMAVRRSA